MLGHLTEPMTLTDLVGAAMTHEYWAKKPGAYTAQVITMAAKDLRKSGEVVCCNPPDRPKWLPKLYARTS